ncbi:GNAT family N-acetyltransferase [Streptomyces sp. NPDC002763]|uniref:GNAT family N-acetyltransferase n=1 Tax=Streptomyces sp. NPDC002763 TaxID=3154427 RepID=UPI0033273D95
MRNAIEGDLSEIQRLDSEAFPAAPYPYFVLRQFVDAFPRYLLVLDDRRILYGYLQATPPDQGQCWLLSLCVAAKSRRQGLGRLLVTELLARLRAEHVHTVKLSVEPGNTAAIELYAQLGFLYSGSHPDYFGPGESRHLMTLSLRCP